MDHTGDGHEDSPGDLEDWRFRLRARLLDEPPPSDSLERVLGDCPPQYLGRLLPELVALDAARRLGAGQQPELEDYLRLFPEHAAAIRGGWASGPQATAVVGRERTTRGGEFVEVQEAADPAFLGRYRVIRRLGKGGFGLVFLGHDPELDRLVALKTPRADRFATPADREAFLSEARSAARLRHPGIVAIHDVFAENGWPVIVQEYIDGEDLGKRAAARPYPFRELAQLFIALAEPLGYAHTLGLTHCDLTPANILMDAEGRPHIADFGLAVHETSVPSRRGQVIGTLAFMSPEQTRGESHRSDGRTDIWALGVILYKLLTGRLPFAAASSDELFVEIRTSDPRPPRQWHADVPAELERICLRCLSKRRSDRYAVAADLADDLRQWLDAQASGAQGGTARPGAPAVDSTASASPTELASSESSGGSAQAPLRILPKGLRSFDQQDADFFLALLPGPRDRSGLPDQIRFWKQQLEEIDPDETFSVGLLYGPSGCGKSSLMKAGLLPRLASRVATVYVEAEPGDTEQRLWRQLRRRVPDLPLEIDLPEAFRFLRERGAGRFGKVVVIIDQFEQWLLTHHDFRQEPLADALRQCDGGRLQAVLMVRDDFYLAVNRLFQELDLRLAEGRNFAAVDLFDQRHAVKVLAAFGRAYGKLPDQLTREQEQFLQRVVAELAENGKVISIRLSVLADMMKGREWTWESLSGAGGVGGLGELFLEEMFSARTAPPANRAHEHAARRLLEALLPEADAEVKGGRRSVRQLQDASGYADRPRDFEQLLAILDQQLHLITPAEHAAEVADGGPNHSAAYQLTHDYLVPALRSWLTRKQRETARGRAYLRLRELSAAWAVHSDRRHLPRLWDWGRIAWFTRRDQRSELENRFFEAATRVNLLRLLAQAAGVVAMVLLLLMFRSMAGQSRVNGLVAQALNAPPYRLPDQVGVLAPESDLAIASLSRAWRDSDLDATRRLRAACLLAELGAAPPERDMVALIALAPPSDAANLVAALSRMDRRRVLAEIGDAAAASAAGQDWEVAARHAIAALHLGERQLAADMLATDSPDPLRRSWFIETLSNSPGDSTRLAEQAESWTDAQLGGLRSGVLLGLGGADAVADEARRPWTQLAARWYRDHHDSLTHSAAGWLIRRWGEVEPALPKGRSGDWWRSPQSRLTLVRIPAGAFAEGTPLAGQQVQEFWMADREITTELLDRFRNDAEHRVAFPLEAPVPLAPRDLEAKFISPGPDYPAWMVSYHDAVSFCNWLSRWDGLEPAYELSQTGEVDKVGGPVYRVRIMPDAEGYQLPDAAQWEYACRAGTATRFCMGDDVTLLKDYCVHLADGAVQPVGSRYCNAWGLFDMHGGVAEWCRHSETGIPTMHGGCWSFPPDNCASSSQVQTAGSFRYNFLGFRVIRLTVGDRP